MADPMVMQGHLPPPPPQRQASTVQEGATPVPNAAPSNQVPGHPSFRRQRASRACETCHARKVRCDAASLGVPCTNCVAFSIECKIPTPKRKRLQAKAKDSDSERGEVLQDAQSTPQTVGGTPAAETLVKERDRRDRESSWDPDNPYLAIEAAEDFISHQGANEQNQSTGTYAQMVKPKFVRAPIKEAGRVAYLGESSNLSLLVHDSHGTNDVVHYPLPEGVHGGKSKADELDAVEQDILHQRGAFLLPPRGLCDELVDAFFAWVWPVVPVINRSRFMRRYRDPKNPPSILLLQAMLLAGSRVCKNPQIMDATGSTTPAAMTFYKRAKALFDANYEDDRVTIVQALVLMGWYWEGPEDVTKNVFYWTRVAIVVAQGSGMHRSVETSQLSKADKRIWKRIWWTLFTRDRSVAVALGRPCCINTEDSDVEMINEDDFNDDDTDKPAEYSSDPVHVQFFLNYVKLTEIMGLVLSQQYSVASKGRKHNALDLTHSDMALADWLQNCPKEVCWERPRHHFWSALLHSNYYTTLCLLHRAHMPSADASMTTTQHGYIIETSYPSRNIAYQAAGMITSIIESLQAHDQLRYAPAFIVYSLFSALIMHVYQMRSSNAAVVAATEKRMHICMTALKEVSKVWLVAKMVHTLFHSILGNKALEERLQKAAGRRHQKSRQASNAKATPLQPYAEMSTKRKFDDVDMGFSNGAPAPQMSYERSRPQTPAITPSRELPPPSSAMGAPASPRLPRHDAFPGPSRTSTRATTPFGPGPSYPGTPPDLFLVTRNSPTISQDLWHNFQPDQLFPADTSLAFPNASPLEQHSMIDPQLNQSQPLPLPQLHTHPSSQQHQLPHYAQLRHNMSPQQQSLHSHSGSMPQQHQQHQQHQSHDQQQQQHYQPMHQQHQSHDQQQQQHYQPMHHQNEPNNWSQLDMSQQQRPDDSWSNSTVSQGPVVPTTLNVEDWFHFFGLQGTTNGFPAFHQ